MTKTKNKKPTLLTGKKTKLWQIWQVIPKKLLASLFLSLLALFLINQENQKTYRAVLGQKVQVENDSKLIMAWEQYLEERPDYRDGWIQLATKHYNLGQLDKAKKALSKAKLLDPDNQVVENLEALFFED